MCGIAIGIIKGNTRTSDNGSYRVLGSGTLNLNNPKP